MVGPIFRSVCLWLLCISSAALNPPPNPKSISPASGPRQGGTAVTISGANFATGAIVKFGGVAANNVVVVNSTTITAITPAHSAGASSVTVTNPDGQTVAIQPLINPGFELGNTAWVFGGTGSANIMQNSAQAHSGNYFAQLTAPAGGHAYLSALVGSGNSQYLPVNPGDVITFGGWASRVSGDGLAQWVLQVTDANRANPVYISSGNVTTSTWTLLQQTYTIPAGKAYIRLYSEIFKNTLSASANFDDAFVQKKVLPLVNSDFDSGMTGWVSGGTGTATVVADMTKAHSGEDFAELNSGAGNHPLFSALFSGNSQYLAVNPGDVITFGGWASRVSGDGLAHWVLQVTDANKANPSYVVTANATSSTWTFFQQSYAVPAGKAFIRFYAEIFQNTVAAQANFDDSILQQTVAPAVFTFNPAPTITSVSPGTGSTLGGHNFTVSGSNFLTGATVSVGVSAATNVTLVNTNTITATTPPSSAGAANVTVTNPDGQSATLASTVTPLTNPGFESGGNGWLWNGSGSATVVSNSSLAHAGANFLQLTSAPGNHPGYSALFNGGTSWNAQFLPVNPGNVVTFGGWISRVSGDGFARWMLEVTDSNLANPTFVNTASATAGAWTFFQQSYTVPPGKAFIRLYCEITQNTVTAQADFDDAVLQLAVGGYTYLSPPSLSSISPTSGTTLGGTGVTITGSNFVNGAIVSFGPTSAMNVNVVNGSTITATTPVNAAGPFDVTITNPDGDSATLSNGYTYISSGNPPPTLSSLSPAMGSTQGGTVVALSGANFLSGASVTFGGVPAKNIVVVNTGTITATTPANSRGGAAVTVTNPDGQSSGLQPLTNEGFELGSTGWVFGGTGSAVVIDNPALAHSGNNFVQLTSAPGNQPILSAIIASGNSQYMAVNPGDVITFGGWVSRVLGDGSAQWVLQANDANKANPTYAVTGNASASTWTFFRQSYTVPPGKAFVRLYCEIFKNTVQAQANYDDAFFMRTVASNVFTYITSPGLGWIGPNSGPANTATPVQIAGTNFVPGATVSFGGVQATNVSVVNSMLITATTPASSPGSVAVVVTNPGGLTSAPALTYVFNAAPIITSVSPVSGPLAGGAGITISGANFLPGTKLMIGGTPAQNVVVSASSITGMTAAHSAGLVDVVVQNPDGQSATDSAAYTYLQPPPSVSTISPASGSTNGGTAVVLGGANFLPNPTVKFGSNAATVVSAGPGAISVITPAGSGAGAVNVTIINSDGQSRTLASGFNYVSPTATPKVTSISSSSGPTAGGVSVTISGANFVSGATVNFDGIAANNVSVVNSSTITATTPPHGPAKVSITVINPDGQSATLFGAISLLPNASFESGALDWQFAGSGSAVIQNDSDADDGINDALLTSNAGGSAALYSTDSSGTVQYFPVTAGDVITFGGSAYRIAGNGFANFTLIVTDSNKNVLASLVTAPNNATTPVWAHMLGTYTVPSGAAFIRFGAQIVGNTATAQASFDNAILRRAPAGGGYTYVGLSSPGVFTHHYDNLRTGQNTHENILTPANVNSTQFGKKFSYPVDGWIHGQPLYVANVMIGGTPHNVVYVATEHDSVYAFDADGAQGTPLWHVSFINPGAGITTVPAIEVIPGVNGQTEYGITATPVIDPVAGTIYVLARTKESGTYVQRLHALDITSGAERPNSPALIQAAVPGTGAGSAGGQLAYDAFLQNVRAGLVLVNGTVYFAAASLGDLGNYHGWVLGYDATTLKLAGVFSDTPNGSQGGIWQSGGGIGADAVGNIYVQTGNGTFDLDAGGQDFGNAILKLHLGSIGLNAVDYFAAFNQNQLNVDDLDIASGAAVLLPDQPGPHPHELIGGGKQGTIYVVDRDDMGGYNAAGDSQIVQELPGALSQTTDTLDAGLWGTPTYWNGFVYFTGRQDVIKVFALKNGLLTGPVFQGTSVMRIPEAAISSNGAYNAILWVAQTEPDNILRAYNPYDVTKEYYNTGLAGTRDTPGNITRFVVPLVVNGKVYVATKLELDVYGLL